MARGYLAPMVRLLCLNWPTACWLIADLERPNVSPSRYIMVCAMGGIIDELSPHCGDFL